MKVRIANDIIADGQSRAGGSIADLTDETAAILIGRGAARPLTAYELAALEPPPALAPAPARKPAPKAAEE